VLAEFPSVVDAVQCAVQVQQELAEANEGLPEERRMCFRIGVHVGDVMVRGGDLVGDAINIASRLQALAAPGGVCLSAVSHEYIRHVLPLNFDDLGPQSVKNIAEPIPAYSIRPTGSNTQALFQASLPSRFLAPQDRPSIAVLPFAAANSDDEYLVEGICDDIITALYKMRWLFVIARNTTFAFKGRAVDVTQIARQLGVAYVLSGSLRRVSDRVRISAQLIEADTGGSLWAERYDRDLTDIFALQDEIAGQVAAAIEPELLRRESQRVAARPAQNLTAWDLVRRGTWEFHKFAPEAAHKAQELFRRAIAADPNHAEGYLWLARTTGQLVAYHWTDDPETALREGMHAASQAVLLDEKNPYAHYAVTITHTFGGEFDAAIEAARRSIFLSPSFALGHLGLGSAMLFAGQPQEAIRAFERGLRLNPFDPQGFAWHLQLAASYFFSQEPKKGLDHALSALSIRPHWGPALVIAALCSAQLGDIPRAKAALADPNTLEGTKAGVLGRLLHYNPKWHEQVRLTLEQARVASHEGSLPK
jgi:adenylate cyclase